MTYQELKSFLETLTPEQLQQPAVIFLDDEEQGHEIDHWDITGDDTYWERHGDCLGNIEQAKESLGDDWEDEKDDLIIVPKNTVYLFTI